VEGESGRHTPFEIVHPEVTVLGLVVENVKDNPVWIRSDVERGVGGRFTQGSDLAACPVAPRQPVNASPGAVEYESSVLGCRKRRVAGARRPHVICNWSRVAGELGR